MSAAFMLASRAARALPMGWMVALAVMGAWPAEASLQVEPGSKGNLLIMTFVSSDPQIPFMGTLAPRTLPSYVEYWAPQMARTVPDVALPGETCEARMVFDISDAAMPGGPDDLVLDLVRAEGDTIPITLQLQVVAATPLSRNVRVLFTADVSTVPNPPGGGDLVQALIDGSMPVSLHDDGVAPDAVAGDGRWTGNRVFATGSERRHRYALAINAVPECDDRFAGDLRTFTVDDITHDDGLNPQVLPTALYGVCNTVGVPVAPTVGVRVFLLPNAPNPFVDQTTFAWSQPRAGWASLRVYDVSGRLVATPVLGSFAAGRHQVAWRAADSNGGELRAGVYIARLVVNGEPSRARRIVVVR